MTMSLKQAKDWSLHLAAQLDALEDAAWAAEDPIQQNIVLVNTPVPLLTTVGDLLLMGRTILDDQPIEHVTQRWTEAVINMVSYLSNTRLATEDDIKHMTRLMRVQ